MKPFLYKYDKYGIHNIIEQNKTIIIYETTKNQPFHYQPRHKIVG